MVPACNTNGLERANGLAKTCDMKIFPKEQCNSYTKMFALQYIAATNGLKVIIIIACHW